MEFQETSRQDLINHRGYRKNIKGDKFSLFISNYPVNAKYLKSRIGNPKLVLAELCCSIGVTLEYLAPCFEKVIGVDLDRDVLDMCKTNLKESGLGEKAKLICGDVFDEKILRNIEADIVLYDIPYWYPHQQENQGNLLIKNPTLKKLIKKIQKFITKDIVVFSPPEWTYEYAKKLLCEIEFEKVFIDQRHNRNQIYMGDLIKKEGKTKIKLKNGNL